MARNAVAPLLAEISPAPERAVRDTARRRRGGTAADAMIRASSLSHGVPGGRESRRQPPRLFGSAVRSRRSDVRFHADSPRKYHGEKSPSDSPPRETTPPEAAHAAPLLRAASTPMDAAVREF